jgi:hypothetical protein
MKTTNKFYVLIMVIFVFAGNAAAFTEGYSNNFFGTGAGASPSNSGQYNIFMGGDAGYSNTSGDENSFYGYQAGYSNTVGYSNTFNGYQAGYSNISGEMNTFNGHRAGYSNTSGDENLFNGYRTGFRNTVGYSNTFNGYQAGYSNISGSVNTFNGNKAGFYNTEGTANTFNGYQAGYSNTTGGSNTYYGSYAGHRNTTGNRNIFLGYTAGYFETGSDKLYIDNSNTSTPLIYGEFDNDIVVINADLTATSLSGDGSGLTNVQTSAHTHSGADITSGIVLESYIDTAIARVSDVNAHSSRIDNPHGVIAAQVGAADASHNHDADYVNISGDTITGSLSVGGNINTSGGAYQSDGVTAFKTESDNTFVGRNSGYNNSGAGNVFIGYQTGYNESGNYKLYIDNSSTAAPLIYGEFNNGFIEINGDFYVTGNTYVDSDKKLKEDIKPIKSSLQKILGIQGVSYKWKNKNLADKKTYGRRHYGVVAQQVEEVLPEIVNEDQDNKKRVAYLELIPVLIEAVKEQQKTIFDLSDKVQTLEKELQLREVLVMADIN